MKRYKKDKTYLFYALTALQEKVTWSMDDLEVSNWHQYDALLALYTAEKFNRKTCSSCGDEEEGLIYF